MSARSRPWHTRSDLKKFSSVSPKRPRHNAVTQLQEGSLHCKKEKRRDAINAEFHANECGSGFKIDAVHAAELSYTVNDEFLHEVGTVSNTCDEGRAGNRKPAQW